MASDSLSLFPSPFPPLRPHTLPTLPLPIPLYVCVVVCVCITLWTEGKEEERGKEGGRRDGQKEETEGWAGRKAEARHGTVRQASKHPWLPAPCSNPTPRHRFT